MANTSFRELEFPSRFGRAKEAADRIVAEAATKGYEQETLFALRLSLEEAFTNAIRHGNRGDRRKKVSVRYRVGPERIDVYVSDEGAGFDPKAVPDPTHPENLSRPSGRGILLMRAYMTEVEYNKKGNTVHLVMVRDHRQGRSAS